MRAVIQRVREASVTVDEGVVGATGPGVVVLLGVARGDGEEDARRLAGKVARLRIFENEEGRFDRSLLDIQGEALVVSQFTLIADTRKGNRPSFTDAADPAEAETLYEVFCDVLAERRRPGVTRRLRRPHGGRARERRAGDHRARDVDAPAAIVERMGARSATAILFAKDAAASADWYGKLGFEIEFTHRFDHHSPLFVGLVVGRRPDHALGAQR